MSENQAQIKNIVNIVDIGGSICFNEDISCNSQNNIVSAKCLQDNMLFRRNKYSKKLVSQSPYIPPSILTGRHKNYIKDSNYLQSSRFKQDTFLSQINTKSEEIIDKSNSLDLSIQYSLNDCEQLEDQKQLTNILISETHDLSLKTQGVIEIEPKKLNPIIKEIIPDIKYAILKSWESSIEINRSKTNQPYISKSTKISARKKKNYPLSREERLKKWKKDLTFTPNKNSQRDTNNINSLLSIEKQNYNKLYSLYPALKQIKSSTEADLISINDIINYAECDYKKLITTKSQLIKEMANDKSLNGFILIIMTFIFEVLTSIFSHQIPTTLTFLHNSYLVVLQRINICATLLQECDIYEERVQAKLEDVINRVKEEYTEKDRLLQIELDQTNELSNELQKVYNKLLSQAQLGIGNGKITLPPINLDNTITETYSES